MEAIYDVISYLNKFDFTDNVNDSDYENLRCIRRKQVNEFESNNIHLLIDVSCLVDSSIITLTIGKLQDILNKTNALREKKSYLISFTHFIRSICEPDL